MDPIPERKFMRGALPTPRCKLAGAIPFRPIRGVPSAVAWVPKQLSAWLNDQYGVCVTSEEAFKDACNIPEDFIADSEVKRWASKYGWLNGAYLLEVMEKMQRDGFRSGVEEIRDGNPMSVDYSDEDTLKAAIALGPVKIGIDADALPNGAGQHQGWYAFGGPSRRNEDHCVALCGYGPAAHCFAALGGVVPSGVDPAKPTYLLFTWGTIGVVDFAWIMSTCEEAWVRVPNSIFVPPRPTPPTPPVPPTPPTPPYPVPPMPVGTLNVDLRLGGATFGLPITGTITPTLQRGILAGARPLPPWVLLALRVACAQAPYLPPPWNAIAQAACALLPQQEELPH